MYLYSSLLQRETDSNPVRVGLIGAGKFGSMFLAQVPTTPGLVVTTIADLDPAQAMLRCREVGWDDARVASTEFVDDAEVMIRGDQVDVVVEATGHPAAGIKHALLCAEHGKHVVMVNVEADVLAGPLGDCRWAACGEVAIVPPGQAASWCRGAAGFPHGVGGTRQCRCGKGVDGDHSRLVEPRTVLGVKYEEALLRRASVAAAAQLELDRRSDA